MSPFQVNFIQLSIYKSDIHICSLTRQLLLPLPRNKWVIFLTINYEAGLLSYTQNFLLRYPTSSSFLTLAGLQGKSLSKHL